MLEKRQRHLAPPARTFPLAWFFRPKRRTKEGTKNRPKRRTKEGTKKGLLFTFFITSSSAGGWPAGSFKAGCNKWPGGLVF